MQYAMRPTYNCVVAVQENNAHELFYAPPFRLKAIQRLPMLPLNCELALVVFTRHLQVVQVQSHSVALKTGRNVDLE